MITSCLMITPCFHTMCFGCQRSRIENKDKCPECNVKIDKLLHPITVMDQVVNKYKEKRTAIREILKSDLIKNILQ